MWPLCDVSLRPLREIPSMILRESKKLLTNELRVKEDAGARATSLRTGIEVEADGRVFVTVRFLNENCPLLRNTDKILYFSYCD